MHRSRPPLSLLLVLAAVGALALGTAASPARAETPVIYKWVDENGVAHYTTDRGRIPSAIRDRVTQGGGAASGDWLRRDAGPASATPAPGAASAAVPAAPTAPTAPGVREPAGVEPPEASDGVHAVEAEPDWSQAPGGEAEWAPGDLGEGGEAPAPARQAAPGRPSAPTKQAAPAPPVETAPVRATAAPAASAPAPDAEAPAPDPSSATAARAPAPPPPPPPPPLEADGEPIAARAAPAAVEEPAPALAAPAAAVEPPAVEPSAPAAVASPAPRDLAPDEQEQLAALDAQIEEVEAKIASDEEALMALISDDGGTPQGALVDDPHFRDIAQRLPKLQADLERLRERRAQIQPVVPSP